MTPKQAAAKADAMVSRIAVMEAKAASWHDRANALRRRQRELRAFASQAEANR